MHPGIHEDNARTLQGVIDTQRAITDVPAGGNLIDAARRLVDAQVKPERGKVHHQALSLDELSQVIAHCRDHVALGVAEMPGRDVSARLF